MNDSPNAYPEITQPLRASRLHSTFVNRHSAASPSLRFRRLCVFPLLRASMPYCLNASVPSCLETREKDFTQTNPKTRPAGSKTRCYPLGVWLRLGSLSRSPRPAHPLRPRPSQFDNRHSTIDNSPRRSAAPAQCHIVTLREKTVLAKRTHLTLMLDECKPCRCLDHRHDSPPDD